MTGGTRGVRLAVGSLAIALALTGCAGRSWQFWKSSAMQEPVTPAPVVQTGEDPPPAASVAAAPTTPTARPAQQPVVPAARSFVDVPALGDVHFRPGLVTVGKADAKALDAVARWLKDNPGSVVRIEGHTDDLGTAPENLAVGQKRAASAMKYLIDKGVNAERISIVSFGSDRPLCADKTDACRARNRRVHFVVSQQ